MPHGHGQAAPSLLMALPGHGPSLTTSSFPTSPKQALPTVNSFSQIVSKHKSVLDRAVGKASSMLAAGPSLAVSSVHPASPPAPLPTLGQVWRAGAAGSACGCRGQSAAVGTASNLLLLTWGPVSQYPPLLFHPQLAVPPSELSLTLPDTQESQKLCVCVMPWGIWE